jgi:hypothetical protein
VKYARYAPHDRRSPQQYVSVRTSLETPEGRRRTPGLPSQQHPESEDATGQYFSTTRTALRSSPFPPSFPSRLYITITGSDVPRMNRLPGRATCRAGPGRCAVFPALEIVAPGSHLKPSIHRRFIVDRHDSWIHAKAAEHERKGGEFRNPMRRGRRVLLGAPRRP